MKKTANQYQIQEINTIQNGARLFNIFSNRYYIATLWQRPDPEPTPKLCIFINGYDLKKKIKKEIIQQLKGHYRQPC